MSRKYLTDLDLAQNQLLNARVQNLAAQPGTPAATPKGVIYYNSADNTLYWNDGTTWQAAKSGSGTPTGSASGDLGGNYPSPTVLKSQSGFTVGTPGGVGTMSLTDALFVGVNGLTESVRTRLAADTQNRFHVTAGGVVNFGTGAATPDTNLYRSAANTLKTDDDFVSTGTIYANTTTPVALSTDSRFTDSRAPSGAATGDLAGSYPNPTIGIGKVTGLHIADGTITDADVATTNKDGTGTVPSMRTLGYGSLQAMPGATPLNGITAPVDHLSMNSLRILNLADPSGAQDAATKLYVDNAIQGLDAKQSVRVAATGNVVFAGGAPLTVDGVVVAPFDRILVMNQTNHAEDGIYVVGTAGTGSNGTWTRAADADSAAELKSAYVWVQQGTAYLDTGWVQTANVTSVGTTPQLWVQFAGAGSVIGGNGLTKTGNTLDVQVDGTGIEIVADTVRLKDGGVTSAKIADGTIVQADLHASLISMIQSMAPGVTDEGTAVLTGIAGLNFIGAGVTAANAGAGIVSVTIPGGIRTVSANCAAATSTAVVHNLSTRDVQVQAYRTTTPWDTVECDVERTDVNTVTVRFNAAPAAGDYRIVVQG